MHYANKQGKVGQKLEDELGLKGAVSRSGDALLWGWERADSHKN